MIKLANVLAYININMIYLCLSTHFCILKAREETRRSIESVKSLPEYKDRTAMEKLTREIDQVTDFMTHLL